MNILTPVQKLAGAIFGKGPKVDGKTRLARLSKCYTCSHLFTLTRQCKKCTCFVEEKTLYQNDNCPVGKW
jgi:hypothetical protein